MSKWLSDILIDEYSQNTGRSHIPWVDNDAGYARDLVQDLAEKIVRNDTQASNYEKPLGVLLQDHRQQTAGRPVRAGADAAFPAEEIDTFSTWKGNVERRRRSTIRARDMFQKELLTLSPEMREAFMMVYFDGFRCRKRRSAFVGIEKNTVKPAVSQVYA